MYSSIFYLLAVLILASTAIAVTRRNMVHAVIYLVISFFGSALLFYLFGAPLLAALEGRPLARFAPQKNYLLILNMGNGRGVLAKGSLALDGRWAFRLKDGIDRRFIRRFQLSGELDDPADIENEPA